MEPFSIQCTTCRRTLRVVNPEAIGQILSCPKCGSMVLIEAPTVGTEASTTAMAAPVIATPAAQVEAPAIVIEPAPTRAVPETSVSPAMPVMKAMPVAEQAPKSAAAVEAIPLALAVVEQPMAAGRWPWWFWPGVGATVTVSGLIVAIRLLLFSGTEDAATVTVASARTDEFIAVEKSVEAAENNADETPLKPTAQSATQDQPAAVEPLPTAALEVAPVTPAISEPPPLPVPSDAAAPTVVEGVSAAPGDPPPAEMPEAPAADSPAGGDEEQNNAAQPTMLRVPPRAVDVDLRLAEPIPTLEARDMPLWAVLELIGELSTIPITLDLEAIVGRGQSAAMPVTVPPTSGKAADVLEAVLEPLGLGYQVREGQLIVGHPAPDEMRRARYSVSDLVGSDQQTLAELGAVVRRMVAPASWQEAGGRGSMAVGGGTLVVEQADPAHLELLVLCEKLRVARGKPTKSRYDPVRFLLTSRGAKASDILGRPVTANFSAPHPLAGVVSWLRRATGATIVIDHAALARSGMSQESECAVVADKKPLSWVLNELLEPIDLAWRAVDERTIEITTRQAAARRMDIEFYPVRDLAADAKTGQALAERINREIEPRAWGGRPTDAALYFDGAGRTLIVRAPYRIQVQVEENLAGSRRNRR